MPNPTDAQHRQRMRKKQARMVERVDAADRDQGVLVVLTGTGKGKSSSAFGMVARALGHDLRVAIVQFIKSPREGGETAFFDQFENCQIHVLGAGFSWETQDASVDQQAATAAWSKAAGFLADPEIDLVVLDELNVTLAKGQLPLEPVLAALSQRPKHQHCVITGRRAPEALIDLADTVTEMRDQKHAFRAGIRAQKGVDL